MSRQSIEETSPDTALEGYKRTLAIIAIGIGYILNPLNGSLIVTAFPALSDTFGVPYAHISVMVMYFMAATAVAQPLAGGLGDFFGRKNVFLAGIVGMVVSSAFAGDAGSYEALLVWRVSQAVFSGVIIANGLALLGQVVPREKIGIYVGALNSIFVASTAIGFPLGGVLLQAFDWHLLFWINIPVGVVALILALVFIPRDSGSRVRFTALSFLGVPFIPCVLGLQALIQGDSAVVYVAAFLAAVALLTWGIYSSERSRRQLKGITNLRFNLGCLVIFFTAGLQFSIIFALPAWTFVALGIEAGLLGLYLSGQALSNMVSGPLAGRVLDTFGDGFARAFTLIAFSAGLFLLLFQLNKITFAVALVIHGSALAVSQLIAQRASILSTPRESQGLAMGILNSWRAIGAVAGNAAAAYILAGYPVVTEQAGIQVVQWACYLFLLPLALTMWRLREKFPGHTV